MEFLLAFGITNKIEWWSSVSYRFGYSSIILSFLSKNIDWLRRRGNKKIESIFFVHQQSCGGIVTTNLVFYSRNVNEWAFTTEYRDWGECARESRGGYYWEMEESFCTTQKKREGKVDHRKKSFSSRGSTLNTLLSYVAYKWCDATIYNDAEQCTPIQKWLHLVVVKA